MSAACMAAPALAEKLYDAGASDTEIRLGMSMPFSGPAASYGTVGRVAEAYFRMVNEKGGINGRKVTLFTYDDQYSPPKTVEVTRRMVEQDGVLAVVGTLGTAANTALLRYMNGKQVPQLFLGVGATKFNDPRANPWTVPLLPSYEGEGRIYGREILKANPNAKVAVLYQNDDFGKDLLKGLKEALKAQPKAIVAEATYEVTDPTVDSQIVQLKASGADTVVILATQRAASQAIRKAYEIGWRPQQKFVSSVSANVTTTMRPAGFDAATGMTSVNYYKDPSDARWADDPATKQFKAFMQKYAPNEDANNPNSAYGYNLSQLMTQVLRSSGDNLTRKNVLAQATHLKDVKLDMLLPGVALNNSPADYYPVRTLQLVRFDGKQFEPVGAPVPDR